MPKVKNNVHSRHFIKFSTYENSTMNETLKPMTELPKPVFDKTPGSQRETKQNKSPVSLKSDKNSPVYDQT